MSLFAWIVQEPSLGLVVLSAAVVYLITCLAGGVGARASFWQWLRHILLAVVKAALLFGLIVGCRGVLIQLYRVYDDTHNQKLWEDRWAVQDRWGKSIDQYELEVIHYAPSGAVQRIIEQNSIVGFNGQVSVALTDGSKNGQPRESFNSYLLTARYAYDVVNEADVVARTLFRFPLPVDRVWFDDFQIMLDGRDLSPELKFSDGQASWWLTMQPGQQAEVMVVYITSGMESYLYLLPEQREIKDFHFELTVVDGERHSLWYSPDDEIMVANRAFSEDTGDLVYTWNLDRIVVAPQMGLAFKQYRIPYNPYEAAGRIVEFAPNGYVILAALWVLSTLIRREPVALFQLAALSGIGCLFPLVVAGTADLLGGLTGSAILGGVLVALLTVLLFHKRVKPLLEVLTYLFVALFTLAYPFQGLSFDQQLLNTIKAILWGVILIYLFGLTVFTQFQLHRQRLQADELPIA